MTDEPRCDFCSSINVKWRYPVDDFSQVIERDNHPTQIEWNSIGDWAACGTCHALIEADLRDMLATRVTKTFLSEHETTLSEDSIFRKIRTLHDEFYAMRSGPPKEV